MYDTLPSFVLGFHGCDRSVAERVFAGKTHLRPSENEYDWLGHGIYFWENNPRRALDFARLLKRFPQRSRSVIRHPSVIGAVIDLGFCLNLLNSQFIGLAKRAFERLESLHRAAGTNLPLNSHVWGSRDLLLRPLDCAVIETAHSIRTEDGLPPFDSVRGVFVEGEEIYPGAGINEFNHIQICIRNPKQIKGYFRVIK